MDKIAEFSPDARSRFDYSQAKKRLDDVFSRADERFSALVANERFHEFVEDAISPYLNMVPIGAPRQNQKSASLSPSSNRKIRCQLRLGATRLTSKELSELTADNIIPLSDSTRDQIQIWSEGELIGQGKLFVADGKFVVRVESILSKRR